MSDAESDRNTARSAASPLPNANLSDSRRGKQGFLQSLTGFFVYLLIDETQHRDLVLRLRGNIG